jgi:hypothetical protein
MSYQGKYKEIEVHSGITTGYAFAMTRMVKRKATNGHYKKLERKFVLNILLFDIWIIVYISKNVSRN